MKKTITYRFLHTTAIIVAIVGVIGSLFFMFNAGRHNNSFILLTLFTLWVFSPFAGIFVAIKIADHWPVLTRISLYYLMIVQTIGSLVAYSGAVSPSGTKPAFMFLVFPLLSWLLMLTVILITIFLSHKQSDKNNSD